MTSTFPAPNNSSWFHSLIDRLSGRAMVRDTIKTGHVKAISLAEFVGALIVLGIALHLVGPLALLSSSPIVGMGTGAGIFAYIIAVPQLIGQTLTRLHLLKDNHRVRMLALYATTAFLSMIAAAHAVEGDTMGAFIFGLLTMTAFSTSRHVHLYNGRDR